MVAAATLVAVGVLVVTGHRLLAKTQVAVQVPNQHSPLLSEVYSLSQSALAVLP